MESLDALLSGTRLLAQQAELRSHTLLGIWTRLRRRVRNQAPLPLPGVDMVMPGVARMELEASDPDGHLELRIPADPGERFVGFGERFNTVDQRGWKLGTWTEEGAIGFGEWLSPWLTRLGVRFNPWPTGPGYSYKPMPWFLSSRGYGLLFRTHSPVLYDVAATDPSEVRCAVLAPRVEALWFFDGEPQVLLERMTHFVGRAPGLPDWALGVWNDAVGGEQEVRRVAEVLRSNRIPSSVMWTEDWHGAQFRFFGENRWSFYTIFPVMRRKCVELYPELERLADHLHRRGFKFLGYYYPYVHTVDSEYEGMAERGWFLRDREGRTRTFTVFLDQVAQVDLTHPEARQAYAQELAHGLELGFDGWMADFGEYTPPDVVAHDGDPGISHHNRYPLLWAELNRDVLRRARPDGDFVFFSRSAGLGQQAVSPVVWCGDSNTDFERWDGLPSNLPAMLSAGLSGFSVWSTDVGGYKSLLTHARDREVLARWVEMAAFLAVMRTHHGTHPKRSVQFDHDEGTLAHFATYARVHTSLFPLRRALVDEAMRRGTPVCRPLLLHHPSDAQSWSVEDQFLLGPTLMVAPIVERGASARGVYLPPGHRWIELWSGRRIPGGRWVLAHAPLGRIPLYLRDDAVLVTFDTPVDTFVRRGRRVDASLRTLDDAEGSLSAFVGPAASGEHHLWDGTVLEVGDDAEVEDGHGRLPQADPAPHALWPADLLACWSRVGAFLGQRGSAPLEPGRRLSIRGDRSRRWSVHRWSQPEVAV